MSKTLIETYKKLGEMTDIRADLRIIYELTNLCEDQMLYRIIMPEDVQKHDLYFHLVEKLKSLKLYRPDEDIDFITIMEEILTNWKTYARIPVTYTVIADMLEINGLDDVTIPNKTYEFVFNPVAPETMDVETSTQTGGLLDIVLAEMEKKNASPGYMDDVREIYSAGTRECIDDLRRILDVYKD